jgi:hypothetical protein
MIGGPERRGKRTDIQERDRRAGKKGRKGQKCSREMQKKKGRKWGYLVFVTPENSGGQQFAAIFFVNMIVGWVMCT